MHSLRVLICDDMEHVRLSHEHYLVAAGGKIFRSSAESVASPEEAMGLVREAVTSGAPFDLALLDIDFSSLGTDSISGYDLARKVSEISPHTVIVMISAYSTDANLKLAERCPHVERFLRRGELTPKDFLGVCTYALLQKLHRMGSLLPDDRRIASQAPNMISYLRSVDRVDPFQNIVIHGPSGTGKEMTAERLNVNAQILLGQSKRPLIRINCGAIPENLKEGELFGSKRGSFTGSVQDQSGLLEAADGGDLFLDELQDAPISLQTALLRAIGEKECVPLGGRTPKKLNVRFIAAMNVPPNEATSSGRLKPDLLERLQQVQLSIPALRERPGDIPFLIDRFRYARNDVDKSFSSEAIEFLSSLPWPLNVRGLKNVVDEAITQSKIPIISVEALKALSKVQKMLSPSPTEERRKKQTLSGMAPFLKGLVEEWLRSGVPFDEPLRAFEQEALSELWKQERSVTRISRRTKIPESTLRRKLSEYGILDPALSAQTVAQAPSPQA